jgi:hypothetical protein
MALDIRQAGESNYEVFDTETSEVLGKRASEDAAERLQDRLETQLWRKGHDDRLTKMEDRLSRTPTKEMTADEKAAEYDKMIASKNAEPPKVDPKNGDPKPPPAKVPDPTPPVTTKRSAYWGEQTND